MKIIRSVSEMQALAVRLRQEGKIIGFVPTMGYLHEGHLSLIRAVRPRCDKLVASIFVNPTQFGEGEDYDKYPRDIESDECLCRNEGVDYIFYPSVGEMYPEGYSTYIEVEGLTAGLCGISRPGHFRGVTTIVGKLFNIVQPHIAAFGQKDAQQAFVIKRMVRDLNFPIEIVVCPIVREQDGLAMSSRNIYLTENERTIAPVLHRSLGLAELLIESGERDAATIEAKMKEMVTENTKFIIDYIEIVDTDRLKPMDKLSGEVLIAVAAFLGRTRLIDNTIVKID